MEKRILRKVNQAGSMMIEALAMLALVSLVTPTLYKKAAERTMELQDINSATQIRALIKAADSYTAANFKTLVEELGEGGEPQGKSKEISKENLSAYLPEGYQLDSIKNFGSPKAAVKIGGTLGHETLTSYVVLPQQGTLNSVRSARIASMVGANGGIVDKDGDGKVLDGVSNIWKLDKDTFKTLFASDNTIQQYSVGAISEHAIDVGNSTSLENPKYLQRTLDPGEEWRNTMETTLYMGGPTNMDGVGVGYNDIEGVNRLIIGDTTWQANEGTKPLQHDEGEALIIKSHDTQNGSVWIEDSLTALNDKFRLTGSEDNFKLELGDKGADGNPLLVAEQNDTNKIFSIQTDNENKAANQTKDLVINNSGATFNVNTKVDNTFETTGKTSLANTGANTGIVIQPGVAAEGEGQATDSSTNIYTKTTTVYGEEPQAKQMAQIADDERNIIFDVQGSAYVNKALEVGDDKDGETNLYDPNNINKDDPILLSEGDRELNVVGDAFVSDTLEAGFVAAHDFDAMNIHAGGKDYTDNLDKGNNDMGKYNRWLNATENGVFVEDLGVANEENSRNLRMQITDGTTQLYGPKSPNYQYNQNTQQNEVTGYSKGSKLELGGRTADIFTNPDNMNSGRLQLSEREAQLEAYEDVQIYAADLSPQSTGRGYAIPNGTVNIQKGAIIAAGQAGQGNLDNTIDMNAKTLTVSGSAKDSNTALVIVPDDKPAGTKMGYYNSSIITTQVNTIKVIDKNDPKNINGYAGAKHSLLTIESQEKNTVISSGTGKLAPTVGISQSGLGVWGPYSAQNKQILQVDASTNDPTGGENDVGSAGAINTPRDGSVYIRRGAIEIEANTGAGGEDYGADEGLGYIEASRFVANNVNSQGNILSPVYANGSVNGDKYDRYMVNPAYTSVMHDIQLTTRGGARLSDILPDFINKGIYLVTNTYKESSTPTSLLEVDDSSQFASPYLGFVPAPECPAGYARVITLTPASFQMAQAGMLSRDNRGRFYVSESNPVQRGGSLYNIINKNLLAEGNSITGAKLEQKYVMASQDVPAQTMWYLGYDNGPQDKGPTYGDGDSAIQYAPTPLYFQQSTWLKAATPSYEGNRPCSLADPSCQANHWMAIIGFLYPKGEYGALKDALQNVGNDSADIDANAAENANEFYWNLFPVMPDTIEAYATVYCYFDRTGTVDLNNKGDPNYVKQYDPQPDDRGLLQDNTTGDYYKRLNDPHLNYRHPLED